MGSVGSTGQVLRTTRHTRWIPLLAQSFKEHAKDLDVVVSTGSAVQTTCSPLLAQSLKEQAKDLDYMVSACSAAHTSWSPLLAQGLKEHAKDLDFMVSAGSAVRVLEETLHTTCGAHV